MLWTLIKNSLLLKALALLIAGLLVWWSGWLAIAVIVFSVATDILLHKWLSRNPSDLTYSKDILALLSIEENGLLRFGMEQPQPAKNISIRLQQDDKFGYLSIDLNTNGPLHYRFPLSQLQSLQSWLQNHMPDIQIDQRLKAD